MKTAHEIANKMLTEKPPGVVLGGQFYSGSLFSTVCDIARYISSCATSKRAANNKWDAANMATLGTKVKREEAERVRAAAAAGQSTSAYIWQAITERMEREK